MFEYFLISVEPSQVGMYLKGEKDTGVRKSAAKSKTRLNKQLDEVSFIIETKGRNSGCLKADLSKVVQSANKDNLCEQNKENVKFGVRKAKYDYYRIRNNKDAVLTLFESTQLIQPPVDDMLATQNNRCMEVGEENYKFKDSDVSYTKDLIKKTNKIQRRLENE